MRSSVNQVSTSIRIPTLQRTIKGMKGALVEDFKVSKAYQVCIYTYSFIHWCVAKPPQPQTRHQWHLTSDVAQLHAWSWVIWGGRWGRGHCWWLIPMHCMTGWSHNIECFLLFCHPTTTKPFTVACSENPLWVTFYHTRTPKGRAWYPWG